MTSVDRNKHAVIGYSEHALALIFNRSDTPKQVTSAGTSLGGKDRAWVDINDPFVQKGLFCGYFKVLVDGTVSKEEVPTVKPKRGRPRK